MFAEEETRQKCPWALLIKSLEVTGFYRKLPSYLLILDFRERKTT